jgi:undecaprenyl-phosphate 4-deoxy-4-formamido-L-arabinose transferase
MSTLTPGISIIVPVYNSAATLEKLLLRLNVELDLLNCEHEMIFVNDFSKDNSWDKLCELSVVYPKMRLFSLARNFGQHNALLCGIRQARYTVCLTLDDDLQNPPEEIGKLLSVMPVYDVVYGKPPQANNGFLRDIASLITKYTLSKMMGAETAGNISAFRAFKTEIRKAFDDYRGPYVSIDVLLSWGTSKFTALDVKHDPRAAGKSNYTVMALVTHAFNMLTGFTTAPLRLATVTGMVFMLIGIILLLFVIIRYFMEGTTAPGFPFLATIICLFSGVQLFVLGIIGEYIARIHFRTMDKPSYVVEKGEGE